MAIEPAVHATMDSATQARTEGPGPRSFWRRSGVLAVVGAVIALVLGTAYLSIGHNPQPHDVPVAVIGPPAAAQALAEQSRGALETRAVPDMAAAERAIDQRDVYAAVMPTEAGQVKQLVIASAASNQVANFMRRTLGQATPDNVPTITDAKPLPEDDSAGSSVPLLIQVLILGGSIGVLGLRGILPRLEGNPRRGVLPLTFLLLYALMFGLVMTGVAAAFGVGSEAAFGDKVLTLSLVSLAVTASTAALVALIGAAGSAVAGLLYFVLGSQISGGGTAFDFLPSFWAGLGENLPGGAGGTLFRNVLYFPDAATGGQVAVLAAYAGVGLLVLLGLSLFRARRRAQAGSAEGRGEVPTGLTGARA